MENWPLNLVDIVAIVYLVFGALRGLKRGLSGELARLVGLVVIVMVGWQSYDAIGEKLHGVTRLSEDGSRLAGFVVAVVGAAVVVTLLRFILKNLLEFAFKGKVERLGGMTAGTIRSFALVTAIVLVASLSPLPYLRATFGEESRIGRFIVHHLLPAYQRMVIEHPDLDLPAVPGADEAPLGEPDEPGRKEPTPERNETAD